MVCLIWLLILIIRLYLSGMWFGAAPRMDVKKTHAYKKIALCGHNMIIILSLIVNIIEGNL